MLPAGVASKHYRNIQAHHSKTVTHNADGTKTITVSFWYSYGGNGPNIALAQLLHYYNFNYVLKLAALGVPQKVFM